MKTGELIQLRINSASNPEISWGGGGGQIFRRVEMNWLYMNDELFLLGA